MNYAEFVLWMMLIGFGLVIILLFASAINQVADATVIEKDVPCYDRNNNLIVDVVCKEKLRCGRISFLNHKDCP